MLSLLFTAAFGPAEETSQPDEGEIQSLVAKACASDQQAARTLYRIHVHRLYRAVRPMTHSDDDAEEIVQETFVKAFRSLRRYRPKTGARFVSWLLAIALNTAKTRAKRARRLVLIGEDRAIETLVTSRMGTANPAVEEQEIGTAKGALLRALSELEDRDQQLLSLRYGCELSAREVGKILGIKEATVRKRCERLKPKVLRRVLELRDLPSEKNQPMGAM